MEVLLEVEPEREVDERPPARGQLHRGRKAALNHRKIASRKMPMQVRHKLPHFEPRMRTNRGRIDTRPGHHDHAQIGQRARSEERRVGKEWRERWAAESVKRAGPVGGPNNISR